MYKCGHNRERGKQTFIHLSHTIISSLIKTVLNVIYMYLVPNYPHIIHHNCPLKN